jgi:hypothetical protein
MGHAGDQAGQQTDGLLGHLWFGSGFKLPVEFSQFAGKRFVWAIMFVHLRLLRALR